MPTPDLRHLLSDEAPAQPLPATVVVGFAITLAALGVALNGTGLLVPGQLGWLASVALIALALTPCLAIALISLLTLAGILLLHLLINHTHTGLDSVELCMLVTTVAATPVGLGIRRWRQSRRHLRQRDRELALQRALISAVFAGGEGIALLAADGRVLCCNDTGLHLLNLTDNRRVIGYNWFDHWGVQQRRVAQAAWTRAQQGAPAEFDAGAPAFGGDYRHWRVRLVAVAPVDHGERLMLVFFRDISADIEARQALETRGNELKLLLGSIDDGFFAIDRHWRFTHINAHGAGLLRVRGLDDLRGRDLWSLLPDAHRNGLGDLIRQTLDEGRGGEIQWHDDQRDRWFKVRTISNPEGASVLFRDITEQLAEEGRRSEQLARLQVSQELAAVGSWQLDPGSGRLHLSPKALHLLGLPEESPAAEHKRRLLACLHPQDRLSLVQAIIAGDEPEGFDITVRMPDLAGPGGCRHLRWVARAARCGGERHLFGVVQEVTAQIQAGSEEPRGSAHAGPALHPASQPAPRQFAGINPPGNTQESTPLAPA